MTTLWPKQIVQATLDAMTEALATEGRLELRDFGVFEVRVTKARRARNPRTGEEAMAAQRWRVRFWAGKVMAKRINDGAAPANKKTALPMGTGLNSQP